MLPIVLLWIQCHVNCPPICQLLPQLKEKKRTGRKGLTIWQIFVLAQFRLALNIDYDRLHFMVNTNSVLRQLLGIETETGQGSAQKVA